MMKASILTTGDCYQNTIKGDGFLSEVYEMEVSQEADETHYVDIDFRKYMVHSDERLYPENGVSFRVPLHDLSMILVPFLAKCDKMKEQE